MAVSTSISQNGSRGHHKYTLTVTETATSTENNTSTVSIVFKLSPVATGWNWEDHSSVKGTVTVNGKDYSWALPTYNGSSTVTILSKTQTITHASDGSKSINLSFNCEASSSYDYLPGTASKSGSLTLTTIPRESTLAVSGTKTLGSAVTLTVTRHSNSFKHTITAKCGSDTKNVTSGKVTTPPTSYTLPLEWASQNTTGTSVSITFTITTYNADGDTKIGSAKSVTISASMPTSVKPTVSALTVAAGDTASSGHLSRYGGYVQGKSKVKLTATASKSYSSALKTYTFTCSGKTYTSSENNVTTGVLSVTGSVTADAKVTDARGRTSGVKTSAAFTVLPYVSPGISLEVHRCDSAGDESMTGTYCRVDWEGSISSLNNVNTGSVTVRYKKSTSETYTEVAGQPISSEYLTPPFMFQADDDSTYDVMVVLQDDFASVSATAKLSTAGVPMHFKKNGKGIAIGKIAEDERDGLDVGWDLWVKDVDMTIQDSEYTQLAPAPASGTPKRLFSIFKNIFKRNSPASGGTTLSMVNTGDMYTWNNKASTSVASTSANGLMSSADKTKLNAVGDIGGAINGSTSIANKSVPGDSTVTELGSFELSKGVWVVKIQVRFNANANGNRTIYLSNTSGGDAISVWNTNKVPASPTNYTHVPLITFLRVDGDSATYHITAQQNSGSAITAAIRWGAIKISN